MRSSLTQEAANQNLDGIADWFDSRSPFPSSFSAFHDYVFQNIYIHIINDHLPTSLDTITSVVDEGRIKT